MLAIDMDRPMAEQLKLLDQYPIKTRVSLSGTLVVARDIAHAKIKARLDAGEEMPQYMKDHPVYYAGPAKTPDGMASGSFGPTTVESPAPPAQRRRRSGPPSLLGRTAHRVSRFLLAARNVYHTTPIGAMCITMV
eukprot:SAG11_NODE_892_length_6673_cov_7.963797_4_plen_135_part_00